MTEFAISFGGTMLFLFIIALAEYLRDGDDGD